MMDVIWPAGPGKPNSTDHIIYPKFPWSWGMVPDVQRDGKVTMDDLWLAAKDFGQRGAPYWLRTDVNYCDPTKPLKDRVADGKITMDDLWIIAKFFGARAASGGWVKLG
jgi:hypothetical protein